MTPEIMRFIQRLFEKHARKMRNIVARGVVSMVDDGPKMQTNQIKLLDGELIDGAERVQQYGFTSHPQNEAECFVVFAGADRAHPLIVSVDDRRYRVQAMAAGEVCIYTDEGDKIHCKRNNTIEVTTKHFVVNAEEDVTINTQKFTLNATTEATVNTITSTLNTTVDETNALASSTINTLVADINAATRIGLSTPRLLAQPWQGGLGSASFEMDIEHVGSYAQTGDYAQTGSHRSTGDQVAGSISQMHHVHAGVESGGSTTDQPVG